MDPSRSTFHDALRRIHKVITDHVDLFTIETTLNSATFPDFLGYLKRKESDFTPWDHVSFAAARTFLPLCPFALRRKIFMSMCAPYGLTGVNAGKSEPVHARTIERIYEQQVVPVDGQADVMIVGVPYIGPYDVHSVQNPLLTWCLTLGYIFNMYVNKPLVREGGVLILFHPLERRFDPVFHPSYIDFWDEVLPSTKEPEEIHKRHLDAYATNPRYRDLYRNHYAYHGVHPIYMWTWGVQGMRHLGKIIAVGPKDPSVAERMGIQTATSLPEAIEKATEVTGSDPAITHFHFPPIFLCHVQ
jgi:hypothetical protein